MRRGSFLLTMLCTLLLAAPAALAQAPAKAPQKTSGRFSDDMLTAWNATAKKLIEMAEDFPQAKYDYRPTPEVRSFRQLMLHIAGVNYFYINAVKGAEVGKGEDDPAAENFKTKESVVKYLTRSFADGAALLKEKGERGQRQHVKHPFANLLVTAHSLWMAGVEHGSEHYGNLVTYYRLSGLVPPASRLRR